MGEADVRTLGTEGLEPVDLFATQLVMLAYRVGELVLHRALFTRRVIARIGGLQALLAHGLVMAFGGDMTVGGALHILAQARLLLVRLGELVGAGGQLAAGTGAAQPGFRVARTRKGFLAFRGDITQAALDVTQL